LLLGNRDRGSGVHGRGYMTVKMGCVMIRQREKGD